MMIWKEKNYKLRTTKEHRQRPHIFVPLEKSNTMHLSNILSVFKKTGPDIEKVAVLGATGQQGGSVALSVVLRGIEVVAITRNPDSESAKDLGSHQGIEVRKADLNDVESLKAAFEGCDGAFVVANFLENADVENEMKHYKNAADALKATPSIRHVIFSTLEESVLPGVTDDFKVLHEHKETGKMYVPHLDGKNRSEKFFDGLPTTFLYTSCFFENFTSYFTTQENKDGTYSFTLPLSKDDKMAWTILQDLGTLVASAFLQPKKVIGKRIGQASFYATGDELAEILSKATGKTVTFKSKSWKEYMKSGVPADQELGQMFELWRRKFDEFSRYRQIKEQKKLMDLEMSDPVEYGKSFADRIQVQENNAKDKDSTIPEGDEGQEGDQQEKQEGKDSTIPEGDEAEEGDQQEKQEGRKEGSKQDDDPNGKEKELSKEAQKD